MADPELQDLNSPTQRVGGIPITPAGVDLEKGFLTFPYMHGAVQSQLLAQRLHKARQKAWKAGSKLTSQEAMEQMFRNGSDSKPNPWYHSPENQTDSSTINDLVDSQLITLS